MMEQVTKGDGKKSEKFVLDNIMFKHIMKQS